MAHAGQWRPPWQPQPYAYAEPDGDDIGLSYYQPGPYSYTPSHHQQQEGTLNYGPQAQRQQHWGTQQMAPNYAQQLSNQSPQSPQSPRHPLRLNLPAISEAFHQDKPIKWDRLTEEQRRIASTFPKDLDEDGSTMWQSCKKTVTNWRTWIQWRYWYYYLIILVVFLLVAFVAIYHHQIIRWLTPISKKVNSVAWGWVIPVAILFVISFPPLFGHEIVAILCGVVYSLWIAFGIVALGTLLGELGNFWAFKWCFKRHAEKYERKSLNYACMAHIVREGGFLVILVARLSAIPGHFTTAVFATVGMNIFIFTIAALLSMPKQLAVVYLGVAIAQSGDGRESIKSRIVKYVVLVISAIITLAAAWYLYHKIEQARPMVQARLRAKRYTMLSEARISTEIIAPDGLRSASPHDGDTSVWSDGRQVDAKAENDQAAMGDVTYSIDGDGYPFSANPHAHEASVYPPAPPAQEQRQQRINSRSSWTQRLSAVRSRADHPSPGHQARRSSRNQNSGWSQHSRSRISGEDEESTTGMLSLAAPLAATAVTGAISGYDCSNDSLVSIPAAKEHTDQQYRLARDGQFASGPKFHHPDARHQEQQRLFSESEQKTSPVEPLDMDVLLAATQRKQASPAVQISQGGRPLINPHEGLQLVAPEPPLRQSSHRRQGGSGQLPSSLAGQAPVASSGRYRQTTDEGYSLYSLGTSTVDDVHPMPRREQETGHDDGGVAGQASHDQGRHQRQQPYSQEPTNHPGRQELSTAAAEFSRKNTPPPPSYTSHRF